MTSGSHGARTPAEPFAAYLLAYFLDEGGKSGEQVRLAVSRGPEPLEWDVLGAGEPLLTSTVGAGGVRDPFLVRDTRRDCFVLLATDLRIWPSGDWDNAVRHGSRAIVVWESPDLVNWGVPWRVEVAPEGAGNAWAPKAFWSEERGSWLVFWASALFSTPDRSAGEYQRILMSETLDFREFGAAEIYQDEGHDVIDTTFLEKDGTWYRFSANSLGADPADDRGHHILAERGSSLTDPHFVRIAEDVGRDVMRRGEGPATARALDGERSYLLIDEFGMRGYQLFESSDPGSGQWNWLPRAQLPDGARHGSIIPITESERQRLTGVRLESAS